MTEYFSFDIEINDEFPEGENRPDLSLIKPSTAAYCTNYDDCKFFDDEPYMSKATAQRLVESMMDMLDNGLVPLGWNTTSFDFQLLGHYSGLLEQCGKLALCGVDMMYLVICHKGYMLSLEKALIGANIETKLHNVTLNDGTNLAGMSGAKAPELWRNKEFSAVRDYLRVDVEQPLKLGYHIEKTKTIRWTSNSGKLNSFRTDMLTVKNAFHLPPVDTSWMKDPKNRMDFIDWIPKNILESEGIVL